MIVRNVKWSKSVACDYVELHAGGVDSVGCGRRVCMAGRRGVGRHVNLDWRIAGCDGDSLFCLWTFYGVIGPTGR